MDATPDQEKKSIPPASVADGSLNQSFSEQLRVWAKVTGETGAHAWRAASTATVDLTSKALQKVSDTADRVGKAASSTVSRGLEALGADPEIEASVRSELVKAAPVIGGMVGYADAWRKYHHGKKLGSAEVIDQARKECLMAFADAGVDIATFSVGALAKSSRLMAALFQGTTVTRFVQILKKGRVDLVDDLAARVLKSERTAKIVDSFLESVAPREKAAAP